MKDLTAAYLHSFDKWDSPGFFDKIALVTYSWHRFTNLRFHELILNSVIYWSAHDTYSQIFSPIFSTKLNVVIYIEST